MFIIWGRGVSIRGKGLFHRVQWTSKNPSTKENHRKMSGQVSAHKLHLRQWAEAYHPPQRYKRSQSSLEARLVSRSDHVDPRKLEAFWLPNLYINRMEVAQPPSEHPLSPHEVALGARQLAARPKVPWAFVPKLG